jgi:DnaJ-domain-containing protein 1
MTQETKEKIIRAAYLTLLADKRIVGEERKRLEEIAAALQISEGDLHDLVTKIASTSQYVGPTNKPRT